MDVTEQEEYYTTFFCGILTVIALQYLHYRSQPHDPSLHAMRRNKDAGIWWVITNGEFMRRFSDATRFSTNSLPFKWLQVSTLAV